MKKQIITAVLCLAMIFALAGCAAEVDRGGEAVYMGNPWSDWTSLAEAEKAVGFELGLPEDMVGYRAEVFRTMSGEMLEIIYTDGDARVCVRKQKGEGEDISGDYNTYAKTESADSENGSAVIYSNPDADGVKITADCGGYSWAITAYDGFAGDSAQDFLNLIFSEAAPKKAKIV